MPLIRTILATCDSKVIDCPNALQVPTSTTQPWIFLNDNGWKVRYAWGDDNSVLCPAHGEED